METGPEDIAYWYSSKVTVGSTRAVSPQARSWIWFVGFSTLTDSRGSATGSTKVPTAILTGSYGLWGHTIKMIG